MREAVTLVETVLGPVTDDQLGIIMPHEHFPVRRHSEDTEPLEGYRETVGRMQAVAIRDAASYGVRTMVEVTPIGVGRLVPMMQRISRDTGMQVVASTGFYVGGNRPKWVTERSAEELADLFIRELTEGMQGVSAKAWMIKIGAGGGLTDEDRKVFQAAALASIETGAAITTHTCSAIREHFDFLVKAGADPARLYIGHADFGPDDSREQLHVARHGGHLIFTCWGIQHFVDQDVLANRVCTLVDAGFSDAVLMSVDYSIEVDNDRMKLISMEYECHRRTPGFLFRYALPRLRARGIPDELIHLFTVENPRRMLRRPAGKAVEVKAEAKRPVAIGIRSGLEHRAFSDATEADALEVANGYLAAWPCTRSLDASLLIYWKTLPRFQPEKMWIAYRDGRPCAFLHGERDGEALYIHLLAVAPGAATEAAWLLGEMEAYARRQSVKRLIGPHYRGNAFYGSYVLGCEPYHPHWAIDGTEAWVRAGFRISHPAVIMVRELAVPVIVDAVPPGYVIEECPGRTEYAAKAFGFHALFGEHEVAHCYARLYPDLKTPSGLPVGQIGHVGTDEAHQGKGLAKVMNQMCLARLREWGGGDCLIATGLDNFAALRAYEKAGFQRRYNINEWSKPDNDDRLGGSGAQAIQSEEKEYPE